MRMLTAVVLVPIVLLCAWAGGIWFALLTAIFVAVGGHEWSRLCDMERSLMVALQTSLGPVVAIAFATVGPTAGMLALIAAVGIAGLAGNRIARNSIWPILGVCFLAVPAVAILILRADPQFGLEGVFFLFGVVWLTDIGAYGVGRVIGGPRLAPSISPGKTWAGAVGGLLLAVAGAYWGAGFMEIQLPIGAIPLAIFLSIATQFGDLFESWVKRRFNKKDSGTIVPGHGGILDRIDGLLIAAPVMAAITLAQRGAVALWP